MNIPNKKDDCKIDELVEMRKMVKTGLGLISSLSFDNSDWTNILPVARGREFHKIYINMTKEEACNDEPDRLWVASKVKPLMKRLPEGTKLFITIGDGDFYKVDNAFKFLNRILSSVMRNKIPFKKVVVPIDASIVNEDNKEFLRELVTFSTKARSFICVNIHPQKILGEDAKFESFSEIYDNVVSFIKSLDVRGCKTIKLVVTDTSWSGNSRDIVDYMKYISVIRKRGTPKNPGPKEVLLSNLYDIIDAHKNQ